MLRTQGLLHLGTHLCLIRGSLVKPGLQVQVPGAVHLLLTHNGEQMGSQRYLSFKFLLKLLLLQVQFSGDEHRPLMHGLEHLRTHRYLFLGSLVYPGLHEQVSGAVHFPLKHFFEQWGMQWFLLSFTKPLQHSLVTTSSVYV